MEDGLAEKVQVDAEGEGEATEEVSVAVEEVKEVEQVAADGEGAFGDQEVEIVMTEPSEPIIEDTAVGTLINDSISAATISERP